MQNNPEFTFEDFEALASMGSIELSLYTRVYTDMYLKLTMGFYYQKGKTPDFVYKIAEVWANGVAELYENGD